MRFSSQSLETLVEGAADYFELVLTAELDEVDSITTDADGQLRILFGMLHSIFQHFAVEHVHVEVVCTFGEVNSAGSLARKVQPIEGTVFCSPEPGFSVVSADTKALTLSMIDGKGNVIHTVKRTK